MARYVFGVISIMLMMVAQSSCSVPDDMILIVPQHKLVLGRTKENSKSRTDWKKTEIKPFLIDVTPITNAQFSVFITKSRLKTEAETLKWSFVFDMFVPEKIKKDITDSIKGAEWWLPVEGAYWKHPTGPGSSVKEKAGHPAVHISYNDAALFCKDRNSRLPTEEEWEFAARGGLRDQMYPWGNAYETKRMNIWEGKFPKENKAKDGHIGVGSVKAFKSQNSYGLYDMIGNTWEWTSTVFGTDKQTKQTQYTLRGGSYVDSVDGTFNHKADVTTRMGNTADAGSDNISFRCARDGEYIKQEL